MLVVPAPIFNANKVKLGIFAANCSGAHSPTTVADRWDSSWEGNLTIAQFADDAGFEFLLPIARWIGYGGKTDFQGEVLETITWATALLARTRQTNVFTTAHTAFHHPIVIAKQIASMDQIGAGRVGLNIVCGWNKPEYAVFGVSLPDDHLTRYEYGQEWFDIVTKLWTNDATFDWDSKYFKLQGVRGRPKPLNGTADNQRCGIQRRAAIRDPQRQAGGTFTAIYPGNWKLHMENANDTMHPEFRTRVIGRKRPHANRCRRV